jgi:hypothetical protein
VVFDMDGTVTEDLVAPWAVRSGTAEIFQAYRDLGYAVILLTGRWTGDLSGFAGFSLADAADFLGIPLCEEICACVWWDPDGSCTEELCEEVCVPAETILDITDVMPFATPELFAWLTELWVELNGLPTPDRTITSPRFILPNDIETFKIEVMQGLIDEGFELSHAYGDDPTDFVAYQAAGIPVEGTFSLRRLLTQDDCLGEGYAACIRDGFEPHTAEYVRALPQVCNTPE